MPEYGIRFSHLGQPTIVIQNASDPKSQHALKFVHTDACESAGNCCVSRVSDEWLQGPPKVGESIPPSTELVVGKLDTTYWFHDHIIFLAFAAYPDIVLAVSVATYASGNVRFSVDRYLPKDSGYNGRADLVALEGETGTITFRIPGPDYWLSEKRANEAYDGTRDDGAEDVVLAGKIVDTALGTLITTCFVVPGWGGAAVGLTLLEGILHLALSPASAQQLTAITQFKALLDSNMKLFQQQHFDELQAEMETATNLFAEEQFGTNKTFTDICKHIDGQKDKFSFNDGLKKSIERCLNDLAKVVADQSGFQKALEQCLGVMSKASNAYENPSKARLAMVFAAISMTMNAYALGTTLCAFVKAESSGWCPASTALMPKIDIFSPEKILSWMLAQKRRISLFRTKDNAKVNRFGHVCMEVDLTSQMKSDKSRLEVYDSGIGVASWGSGSEKDINDLLSKFQFKRDDPNWYEKVPSWCLINSPAGNNEKHKINFDISKRVGEAYKTYLDGLIDAEFTKLVDEPLADLEESGTPYAALLTEPQSPEGVDSEIKSVKIEETQTFVSTIDLKFRYIQYGYSFANSSGSESLTLWQSGAMMKLEPKQGSDNGKATFTYPKGANVTVPRDPWNAKAVAFAAKANEVAKKVDPNHKTILPPLSSSTRIIYRRLCTTENKNEWTDSNSKVAKIWSLDNSAGNDSFFDDWTENIQTLG